MPLFVFLCTFCDHVDEVLRDIAPSNIVCTFCGGKSERDFSKEGVSFRPDIEPGYNESLGMQIGSRRELREVLAFHNAAAPDLMMGGYPSDGRITSAEERVEAVKHESRSGNSVIDKRRNAGWRVNEEAEHVVDEDISVEGRADYKAITADLRKRHQSPAERAVKRGGG